MKKRSLIALVLLLALLLSSCKVVTGGKKYSVYYLSGDVKKSGGSAFTAETVEQKGNEDIISFLCGKLFSQPSGTSARSPFPENTSVLSYTVKNGELSLLLSEEYDSLTGLDETLANYAIALTFCELDDIISVFVSTESGKSSGRLSSENILSSDFDSNPYEKHILLYFPDVSGRYLMPEYHNVTVGQDSSLIHLVAEELINGPLQPSLASAIPNGTKILSVTTNDTVCTLDLSTEFLQNKPETAQAERMTVYSLVNSLSALPGIDSVLITVNGRSVPYYLHMPLYDPLTFSGDLVGQFERAPGEKDISVYAVSVGMDGLTEVPVCVEKDEYQTLEFAVIDKLISLEGNASYINPFPDGLKVLSAVSYNNICRVNFSGEFASFASRELKDMACKSISASLLTFGSISDIHIYINGVRDTSIDSELISDYFSSPELFIK